MEGPIPRMHEAMPILRLTSNGARNIPAIPIRIIIVILGILVTSPVMSSISLL